MDTVPEQPATPPEQAQPVALPPPEDFPRHTILVLVLVFCVIALVSTLALMYLHTAVRGSPAIIMNNGPSSAHAGFTIGHPAPSPIAGATGFATFTIGKPTSPSP